MQLLVHQTQVLEYFSYTAEGGQKTTLFDKGHLTPNADFGQPQKRVIVIAVK